MGGLRFGRVPGVGVRAFWCALLGGFSAWAMGADESTFALLSKSVVQRDGGWQIIYRLEYRGSEPQLLSPDAVDAAVVGSVSNSSLPTHGVPRLSSINVNGSQFAGEKILVENIPGRCRERVTFTYYEESSNAADDDARRTATFAAIETQKAEEAAAAEAEAARLAQIQMERDFPAGHFGGPVPANDQGGEQNLEPVEGERPPPAPAETPKPKAVVNKPVTLKPGAVLNLTFRLEHLHELYGAYDPLLGERKITLRISGEVVFNDEGKNEMVREQYHAHPRDFWAEPPEDRRDRRVSVSGPDSLVLEADLPGKHYYRFEERPVRYASRMRLTFWYLIAPGTEGEVYAQLNQYSQTGSSWVVLGDGEWKQRLPVVGRWTKVEKIIRTEPKATSAAFEVKIVSPPDVGLAWFDDVSLVAVDAPPPGP